MQNIVILAGNVGATPEIRTTHSGTTIANFSLATSRPKFDGQGKVEQDGNGRRVEETEWHRITCFSGLANTVEKYVEKGQKVMVEGRIHYTKWTDQQDVERYGVEIIAEKVTFLSRGKSQQQGTNSGNSGADLDDDVPF
jgi:single-strand DNA-binding protein